MSEESAERTEKGFLFGSYAVAFDSLLYAFAQYPFVKCTWMNVCDGGIPLFGESCGEIPSLHHLDVIFVALDVGHPLQAFWAKTSVKEMPHKHGNTESDGVFMGR